MKTYSLIGLVGLFGLSQFSFAQCPMEGKAIMEKQDKLQKSDSEEETQTLILLDVKSNQKEQRKMKRYSVKTDGNNKKSLLNFTGPKEIKGSAVLNWRDGGTENQWLYLPALKKLNRIASGSKKKYFMGTDFTFADLDGERINDNNYTCTQVAACGKEQCFIIEAKPISKEVKKSTGYSKRILYIEKNQFRTVKIDYYNNKSKHFKTAEYMKWKQEGTVWRPNLAVMTRMGQHKTFIKVDARKINKKIDPIFFSKRYIEKEMHMK